jgi:Fe-S cluster assembly protein SufD
MVSAERVSGEVVETLAAGDPEWLAKRRRAAWAVYGETSLPSSMRDEDWRRTDIGKFDPETLTLHTPSIERTVPDGVVVTDLAEAVSAHAGIVQSQLERVAPGASKFLALHAALTQVGTFILARRGTVIDEPITIVYDTPGATADSLAQALTIVVAEPGARLNVVEVLGSNGSAVTNMLTLIDAGDDAEVHHAVLQNRATDALHFSTHEMRVGKDARLHFFGLATGAKLQKSYWNSTLEGAGADARLDGAVAARGAQHLDHQSLQAHIAPDTVSRLALKVAVWDKAQSVYGGLIDVEKDAVHADGHVQNRNLILSDDARAHSVPRLEIKANDVRCGHGATAGHIDSDQRFYLESRGVPRGEADLMIVRGFFDDVVASIGDEAVRQKVRAVLDEKIGGGEVDGD